MYVFKCHAYFSENLVEDAYICFRCTLHLSIELLEYFCKNIEIFIIVMYLVYISETNILISISFTDYYNYT